MNLLLYFCSKMYPRSAALVQGEVQVNYAEFYQKSLNLASNLATEYGLKQGNRVVLMAKNSIESAVTLFALSRTGSHVYLVNPEISTLQFQKLCSERKFDFIIFEKDQMAMVRSVFGMNQSIVISGSDAPSIESLMSKTPDSIIGKRKAGNVVVFTGGTTGGFKSAGRKQSITDFLNPLVALLEEMQLHEFKTVYVPTPIYHGYGLAALTVAVLLGKEVHFTNGFQAAEACSLIEKHQIEVVTLVPIMLTRMLHENPAALTSLKRILSGGAALNSGLISNTTKQLGPKLFNLYGTSEAGFCILGTPEDLRANPETVGRPIKGVKMRIHSNQQIGTLEIKSRWVMKSRKNSWVETGDLAMMDATDLVFLKGRSDSMIVSGGENVYPTDLENALYLHDQIETVAVIGIPDPEFGSRLKAFVQMKSNQNTSEIELKRWLEGKVARYQMPASIEFLAEMPLTSIGKIDKKVLR